MSLLPFSSQLIADVGISLGDEGKGRLIPEIADELRGTPAAVSVVLKVNGGANSGGSEGSIGEQKDLGNTQQGKNVAQSSGGSSPVVPILIAVVVLAAISIGVVLYRQRKSDQGGSDGRASSPSAS